VMNHQGDLQVASEPGQGTRFTITIPILSPADPPRTSP
jgi:signal transduction histidine kinase